MNPLNKVWDWITGGIAHLIATLIPALRNAISGFVGKLLGTMGLSVVSFQSILPNLKAFVLQQIGGMPGEATAFLGALGVGIALSWVLSALTIKLAWKTFIVPKSVADQLQGGGSP